MSNKGNFFKHPYTPILLSAVPEPNPHVLTPTIFEGGLPSPLNLASGCVFSTRCPKAQDQCKKTPPSIAIPVWFVISQATIHIRNNILMKVK